MARVARPARLVLLVFLMTLLGMLALVLLVATPDLSADGLRTPLLVGTAVLGLGWIVAGGIAQPSVEMYVGAGSASPRSPPILTTPALTDPVLQDLRWRMSFEADVGTALAVLGGILFALGAVTYFSPTAGAVGVVVYAAAVAGLLLVTRRRVARSAGT